MTTASWSTRVRHDSDATYQEWRDEIITKLGLMVTAGKLAADETNITPGAGARPGTNSEQGYAVYHLADSLHGTAPVYIRFGFGTSTGTTSPRLQATVGTSTNGSGVLGGTALTTIGDVMKAGAQTTDTARTSFMCANAGFLGLGWKFDTALGAAGAEGSFFVCRTCDSDGAITVTGAMVHLGVGTGASFTKRQALRFAATAAAYTATTDSTNGCLGFSPQNPTSTTVSGDVQVALGWTITPRAAVLFGVCGVRPNEIAPGTSFNATLVGTTQRTYINLYVTCGTFGPQIPSGTVLHLAILWD